MLVYVVLLLFCPRIVGYGLLRARYFSADFGQTWGDISGVCLPVIGAIAGHWQQHVGQETARYKFGIHDLCLLEN